MLPSRYYILLTRSIRRYSIKAKPKIEVNEEIQNSIENGLFKPRKHPGIFKPRTIHLPKIYIEAMEKALNDFPVKQILNDSVQLVSYLHARHPPIEELDYINKRNEVINHVLSQHADIETLTDEEKYNLKEKHKGKIVKLLKTKIYAWKPVEYNVHTSLQYLIGRSAAEYAALVRIFQEISVRDEHFKPRSLFDFGSGVGTGTWAAKLFWQKSIFEYFNVDCSADMNDLALILLKGGTGVKEAILKGVFYRQFLPATNTTYDLVISAYSLLELPSSKARLETILKLWNKTQEYLVIVEQGTNAGFQIVNEARDFILDIKDEVNKGHVFSPCPHDKVCPRFLTDTTPCSFEISYMTIPIGQNSDLRKENYCYVVLRKGNRRHTSDIWPRIVRPTLLRSKHAICRMCTANGTLEQVVFTAAKHGKTTFRCAKATQLGDLLPITIKPENDEDR